MKRIVYSLVFIILAAGGISDIKLDAQAESYRYWDGRQWVKASRNLYTSHPIEVTYKVKYCYEEAYKMIDLVNAERRKAGVPELTATDEMMDAAMQRAAETALYFSHTRPDGSSYRAASLFIDGENAHHGSDTAKEANDSLVHSPGHYDQMVDPMWVYAGYGYVEIDAGAGCIGHYWVQNFSVANKYYEDGYDIKHPENNKPIPWDSMTIGKRKDYTADFTAKVNPILLSMEAVLKCDWIFEVGADSGEYINARYVGDEIPVEVRVNGCFLSADQYNVKVLTPDICSYKNGRIKALKAGMAKVAVSLKADSSISAEAECRIKDKPVKKGNTYTVSDHAYKVTGTGEKKTVELKKAAVSKKSLSIPKTVKIQGKTYKVTSIAADAFRNDRKLASVTIPATVTKIGKNAFYGCKNLKKITVKTTKLTKKKVGKNAFKGIHKKAVFKVPAKKLGAYKTLFQAKGAGKRIKVKK